MWKKPSSQQQLSSCLLEERSLCKYYDTVAKAKALYKIELYAGLLLDFTAGSRNTIALG
jgi:hypothetical protein